MTDDPVLLEFTWWRSRSLQISILDVIKSVSTVSLVSTDQRLFITAKINISVQSQIRFCFREGFTGLCQIVFAVLPKIFFETNAIYGLLFNTLKKKIRFFSITISRDVFGFPRAVTKNFSSIVLMKRSIKSVALSSPTCLKNKLIPCSWQSFLTTLAVNQDSRSG